MERILVSRRLLDQYYLDSEVSYYVNTTKSYKGYMKRLVPMCLQRIFKRTTAYRRVVQLSYSTDNFDLSYNRKYVWSLSALQMLHLFPSYFVFFALCFIIVIAVFLISIVTLLRCCFYVVNLICFIIFIVFGDDFIHIDIFIHGLFWCVQI